MNQHNTFIQIGARARSIEKVGAWEALAAKAQRQNRHGIWATDDVVCGLLVERRPGY